MTLLLIGQSVELGSALHARVEVLVDRPPAKSNDVPIVYVTKYAGGQVGERSMGISAATARQVAELLNRAADACESVTAVKRSISAASVDAAERAYATTHGTLLGSSS